MLSQHINSLQKWRIDMFVRLFLCFFKWLFYHNFTPRQGTSKEPKKQKTNKNKKTLKKLNLKSYLLDSFGALFSLCSMATQSIHPPPLDNHTGLERKC